jgi:hypothetical protein
MSMVALQTSRTPLARPGQGAALDLSGSGIISTVLLSPRELQGYMITTNGIIWRKLATWIGTRPYLPWTGWCTTLLKRAARLCANEHSAESRRMPIVHIRRALPTAVLALLLVGKAGAEQPPRLLPTSDVDIIYEVTLPSQPRVRERVRYLAAELLERVDGPHKSTTIFDRRTHQMTILTSANRSFLKLDMPRQAEEPGPKATLKRGNESVVASLHCIDWSWTEDVETRTVCITEDGVLLRFVVDGRIVSEARSVSYGPQPAELFQVPPGYSPLLAPEGGPVP